MKSTTRWAIPYPEPGDSTRTWEYWQGIAERVDAILPQSQSSNAGAVLTSGGNGTMLWRSGAGYWAYGNLEPSVPATTVYSPVWANEKTNTGPFVLDATKKIITVPWAGKYLAILNIRLRSVGSAMNANVGFAVNGATQVYLPSTKNLNVDTMVVSLNAVLNVPAAGTVSAIVSADLPHEAFGQGITLTYVGP